jgi:hypothetical protein
VTKTKEEEPYLGDLNKTAILSTLFETPKPQRDEQWTKAFLENVVDASFACGDPKVIGGPDGFPYFDLHIPEPDKPFQCFVIRHMIGDFLLQNGFGVVINPKKPEPDWAFSHGDIVNYHLRGEFYTTVSTPPLPATEVLEKEERVLIGQPSESMLPMTVRQNMARYLEWKKIRDVKILLMSRQGEQGMRQELVFNLTPDRFASHQEYEAIMQSLGWFLPRHYLYVSMDEAGLKNEFVAL